MIRLLEGKDLTYVRDTFLNRWMNAESGLDDRGQRFWQTEGGVLLEQGRSLMYSGTGEDREETACFASFLGARSLESDVRLDITGGFEEISVMRAERFPGAPVPGGYLLKQGGSILDFARFMADNFPGTQEDFLYPHIALRVNRGRAVLIRAEDAGGRMCAGLMLAVTDDMNAVSMLAAGQLHRKRGLASRLLARAGEISPGGLFVRCRKALEGFYALNGFTAVEKTYMYSLNEDY